MAVTVEADTAPVFAAGETVAAQTYEQNTAIEPLTLPAVETAGNGATTYALTPPAGLTFDPATRVLTGTPTTAAAVTEYTYTASDADDDSDTLTFNITVEADTAPVLPGSFPNQNFIVNVAITPLTLPSATGGNGALAYSISLPLGLTFDPATRVITGTPTTAAAAANFAYTARDSDGNTMLSDVATLSVLITVRAQATGFTLSLSDLINGGVPTELREGGTLDVRVVASPTPAGSVFAVAQMVTLTVTPPISRPASAADPFVPYTAIAPGTTPVAANSLSNPAFSLELETQDDAFDHADLPVTLTATASPSGATGTATITLRDDDIGIRTTVTAATVVTGATATYSVQLSEPPPVPVDVAVASLATGTATVSPSTLTFNTTNWNTARTVTVTGVVAGSTTIRHSAPTAGGFSYVPNNVAVTVTAAAATPPTAYTVSINPTMVRESATSTNIEVTVTLTGGTYSVARVFRVLGAGVTATGGGVDYSTVPATNLTIPANMASGSATIAFTATVDTVAEPGGETVRISAGLRTVDMNSGDNSLGVSQFATLTINDPAAPLAVSLGADQTIAPGARIMITGTVTGANAPDASLTASWSHVNGSAYFGAVGGAEVQRLGGLIGTATGLMLNIPGPTAAVLAAATPPVTSVDITIRLTVTDPMAAAGQGAVSDDITITVMPVANTPPTFSGAAIPAQIYVVNQMVTPLTLPAATGGNGAITYNLAAPNGDEITDLSSFIPGLTLDLANRTITGTPTTAAVTRSYGWIAHDGDDDRTFDDRARLVLTISLQENTAPVFTNIGDVHIGH